MIGYSPRRLKTRLPVPPPQTFTFYLVMISCNVGEKSYEEQISPSKGWDLDTNKVIFLFGSSLDKVALGTEQGKVPLLLLGFFYLY